MSEARSLACARDGKYVASRHCCARSRKQLLLAQSPDFGGIIGRFEDGCARYENIGSIFNRHPCRLWINSAVHFDIQCGIVFRLPIASTAHFFHLICAKWLATKTWVHRHDEKKIELGDRKSTRLNSSHSQISYAVFCLTKNNVRA